MSFRERLKLYQEGKLDGEARREIEEAIDREDAILDYLSEREELPAPAESGGEAEGRPVPADEPMEEAFRRELTRRIRRAFLRLGLCVGAAVLVILLLILFVLPHVADRFYYNPGETAATRRTEYNEYATNRMSLDMAVYTELFLPGAYRDTVRVIGHGYGDYDIVIAQTLSRSGVFTDVGGRISKGQLILYDSNTLKRPVTNSFEWCVNLRDPAKSLSEQISPPREMPDGSTELYAMSTAGYPEDARERLEALEDGKYYQGYLSLDRVMQYDDFIVFLKDHELTGVWCAVRLDEYLGAAPCVGFDTMKGRAGNILCWDNDKYPDLKYDNLSKGESLEPWMLKNEAQARVHLTSLLRYMGDQEQFRAMFDVWGNPEDRAERMIGYLEEYGVQIYGFSVTATRETLLELQDCPEIYSVAAKPLR